MPDLRRTYPPTTKILITRPEPGASETARLVSAAGRTTIVTPVMTITPQAPRPTGRVQATLVTSANALAAAPASLQAIPLLAVGDATAARARAAGFTMVHSAGRDAAALADLAERMCDPSGAPLLLLTGSGLGADLAADLRRRKFRVLRRIAYTARPAAALTQAATAVLQADATGHALFFSPASARIFVRLFRRTRPRLTVAGWQALAISTATATFLSPLPWQRIRVASAPNQDALLALLP